MSSNSNPFNKYQKSFTLDGIVYHYFDVSSIDSKFDRLPYSIRVLVESAVRNCDNFNITEKDVKSLLEWTPELKQGVNDVEVPFKPARVIQHDYNGIPAMVDLASMRNAVLKLGGDPSKVNPVTPTVLSICHSVGVDFWRQSDALARNQAAEFRRNKERYAFLKWAAKAFNNFSIVPPGGGILHQVNLEYFATVVFDQDNEDGSKTLYPDSLVGTDSHTTMINGLGVVGWGVGGIEAEAVMLGQSISMLLPEVIGYKLVGKLSPLVTSTDLVLTITKNLRQLGVVGKFVEFYGPGVAELSITDRATIANMGPEYGATVGYFPADENTLNYMKLTNRSEKKIEVVRQYLKVTGQMRNYNDDTKDPQYTQSLYLDLATVVSSISGPKRPHDHMAVVDLPKDFKSCLSSPIGFKGFGLTPEALRTIGEFQWSDGVTYKLQHGSVVLAAITACTNTSNPSVMLGAGLLAKKAVEKGLSILPYIKTSMSPGSGVVAYYLKESGVLTFMEQLGFDIVGFGCMTCIGNSGPLDENVANTIEKKNLVCAGVLSGNRNFEGRIHPNTRANYLASPPLVIAYAIAGRVDIDFEKEPLGVDDRGKSVFLRDIWPTRSEIQDVEAKSVIPSMFQDVYSKFRLGSVEWQGLEVQHDLSIYNWDSASTYIKRPPYFDGMTREVPKIKSIEKARCLLFLGDSVTTDHMSPAGAIARNSPAARFLAGRNVTPQDFNTYGTRRGNDDVMARGCYANIRLVNKLSSKIGPYTEHIPSGEELEVFGAAQRYRNDATPLIVIAGKEYGTGSSRDWAAKGPYMLGIKAIIAESYERIHRSNLVGMGIMPLEFLPGQNADTLELNGREVFNIYLPEIGLKPGQKVRVEANGTTFETMLRCDTEVDITYYQNGGILQYMARKMLSAK
ncbi:LOW QUALITY PROTEIN: cytoplasmic aconitate hydratase-like [Drosophila tropicalis]|uniref:LOW QUALITY PROTEIN: cytoplasmic aconitate hydratase-like n=1 Tax=Drosophila tropicalis TaxID=46794 RepID=UPI0035AB9F07